MYAKRAENNFSKNIQIFTYYIFTYIIYNRGSVILTIISEDIYGLIVRITEPRVYNTQFSKITI